MKTIINNILLPLDSCADDALCEAVKRAGVDKELITRVYVNKRSVDARRNNISFVYSVVIEYLPCETEKTIKFEYGTEKLKHGIVVVGAGPAGLFCAYTLAKNGYKPLLLERGSKVEERAENVAGFYRSGSLDENSNIQFGEGGAGTFSDGKLTTRVNDERAETVLDIFVRHGAKEEILYDKKPHIGTDMLKNIVADMRNEIIKNGGKVMFNTVVSDVEIKDGKLRSVIANGDKIPCDKAVLAIGHSARDTYKMLYNKGIAMCAKAFAMGYRIEHKREFIDKSQYGKFAGHKNLGAADYRLAYNGKDRSCFSFCMCPGGYVVAATSENGGVVVNGMSENSRDGVNSNSAIVAQITPADYGESVLGGIELQRQCERAAFNVTDSYAAPVQNSNDFVKAQKSKAFKGTMPTYPLGYEFYTLDKLLPQPAVNTIKEGLLYFDKRIRGFVNEGVMTGVETRTSAPLRIMRNELMESINCEGLMPVGEGAGYAGGIMSAAIDGIKAAERIMKIYDGN